jgi:hypothetical protein
VEASICLVITRKVVKAISQDSYSPDRHLNLYLSKDVIYGINRPVQTSDEKRVAIISFVQKILNGLGLSRNRQSRL